MPCGRLELSGRPYIRGFFLCRSMRGSGVAVGPESLGVCAVRRGRVYRRQLAIVRGKGIQRRKRMNAVEIEEAVSNLAEAPFDRATFPYAFLQDFGHNDAAIRKQGTVVQARGGR